MKGTITNIQRMSIHDGPGIRSTVFFKGCNLRCKWCHNPETWSSRKQLYYVPGKCIGCGACVDACPTQTLTLTTEKITLNRHWCQGNRKCHLSCPTGGISVIGREYTVDEVMETLLLDKVYYEESGGGVTVSGGEPTLQPDFVREILSACKTEGLHTAIETNLCGEWKLIRTLSPDVDLWICDLKLADRDKHKHWTGAFNDLIIDNLRYLSRTGAPIIVRTAVIPTVNDTEEEIHAICRLLQDLDILYYEMIEFHSLGFDKYIQLGMDNPFPNPQPLDKGLFRYLQTIPGQYGLNSKPEEDAVPNLQTADSALA